MRDDFIDVCNRIIATVYCNYQITFHVCLNCCGIEYSDLKIPFAIEMQRMIVGIVKPETLAIIY